MQEPITNIYTYIEAAYRRKWLFILSALLCTAIGVIIAFNLQPYYLSTTVILIEKQQVAEAYVTPTDRTPFGQRLNTIRQQIMSRPKLEKIINDFNLDKGSGEDEEKSIFSKIINKLGFNAKMTQSKEEVLERMINDIEIKLIGDRKAGDAFSISYSGRDPNITMQITSTLASLFIEENLKVREQYAESTSRFLSDELENAKRDLETQEKLVKSFKEKFMGALPQQLDANLRTLDRLQLEIQSVDSSLRGLEDKKILLEEQLASLDTNQIVVPTGTGRSLTVAPLVSELARLKNELSILLSIYKEQYPDVVTVKKRIKEIEIQLANDKNKDELKPEEQAKTERGIRHPAAYAELMDVKTQIARLKWRDTELRKQIAQFEKRVEGTPSNEQKMLELQRDYNMSLQNYQALLTKKLSSGLAENLEKRQKGERFTIIDPANLPERPYKPNKLAIAFVAFTAGVGIGAGLIFLLEFLNPAFRKPEEFAGVFTHPVLASIPAFNDKHEKKTEKNFKIIKGNKAQGMR